MLYFQNESVFLQHSGAYGPSTPSEREMAGLRNKMFAGAAAAMMAISPAATFSTPAMAQQATKAATTSAQPAEQANPETIKIVNARLKELVPIIKGAELEYERLKLPETVRNNCVAQTRVFTKAVVALKEDPTYSEVIARASMEDLQAMTRFATCTLPEGPAAKLNVCSTFGIALSGKLAGAVFDPKMIDIRPLSVRCPPPPKPVQ